MSEDSEICEHGKKYPCCDCPDPCAEELKRPYGYVILAFLFGDKEARDLIMKWAFDQIHGFKH